MHYINIFMHYINDQLYNCTVAYSSLKELEMYKSTELVHKQVG